MDLRLAICAGGFLATNCYLVRDSATGESFAVDPGFYNARLETALRSFGIETLDYILLTHGHHDHIGGLGALRRQYGGKIVIHESEAPFLRDCSLSLGDAVYDDLQPDLLVRDGDEIPFAGSFIRVLHTPGHTRGSVCYQLEDCLFAGDTVFLESVGRTDLPTGDTRQLLQSVRRLAALDGEYRVFPGHGPQTTLSHERLYNPYF